ncbi:MAG TPA: bifunctional phosphoribosyl-AMP cyclohydrolase/phosphoribosyl-ATP diphosphatase HisIE [Clostridia bacterium]|nr:bifunctional phosphoribosyl-AMP cyclohydrolase/phosphoribosyl-ATP diphosphatase HisIE [Clostridia bacterium]
MIDISMIKFNDQGLVPCIAQDYSTGQVLMLAWMNKQALEKTLETGKAYYFSRSRQALWQKGETSGHFQSVISVKYDCDCDTVLLQVEQAGNACHTGEYSCFFNTLSGSESQGRFLILNELYKLVTNRRENPKEGSYTNYLLNNGIDKIAKKLGEEACEVVIAAKNANKDEIRYETADLLYHLVVLLNERGVGLEEVLAELDKRR